MVLGIQTVETGVFGGIITGVMTALLHNKCNNISLPTYLGFFGGSRFVPIITFQLFVYLTPSPDQKILNFDHSLMCQ